MGDPLTAGPDGRLRFGVFELDARAGELRKRGFRVRLQQQPCELLKLLLEHPGEVVTREAIRERLWPSGIHVDFDKSLNKAVVKLREALGDSADSPRFIETLPRRGYRFVGSLGPEEVAANATHPEASRGGRSALRRAVRGRLVGPAVALGVILATGGALVARDRLFGRPTGTRSVAVLPLANLSGSQEQEYFADGMTEALITDLGKINALRVISRTSVMRYKATKKPLSEIARELGVDALVEGTVARSGSRVRITVNLVQAFPERHLWAQAYERDLHDILALQDDLALAIARGVKARLTPQERAHLAGDRPVDPEAYELYLQGRYLCNQGPDENLWKGRDLFQQAVTKDPGFALGYAWLAIAYDYLADNHRAPARELMPKAKAAALRALELDDTLAEAHASLSVILLEYEWDWAGSEREVKRALELNPNSTMARRSYTWFLAYQGRWDEAITNAREVIGLGHGAGDLEIILVYARRDAEAEKQLRATLSTFPDRAFAHRNLGTLRMRQGRYPEAIAEFQRAHELVGTGPTAGPSPEIACARALSGDKRDAQKLLADLQEHGVPEKLAVLEAALGEPDRAFEHLEKAFEDHAILMIALKVEPALDPLRSDSRFANLLRRVGFPP